MENRRMAAPPPTSSRIGREGLAHTRPGRLRAPRACQRCRQRRERCDAATRGVPCTRCENSGLSDCILVASRRGKYARSDPDALRRNDGAINPARTSIPTPSAEQVDNYPAAPGTECLTQPSMPSSQVRSTAVARPTSTTTPSDHSFVQKDSDAAAVTSYRELTWKALFQNLLDNDHLPHDELVDKYALTYLGEFFPLSMVLEGENEGSRSRVHYAGPKIPDNGARSPEQGEPPLPSLPEEDMRWLEAKGAFEYPDAQLLKTLKTAFVDKFFPVYPIVHLDQTLRLLEARRLPWILLHAICFVSAALCPLSAIHQAGFSSRTEVREHFCVKTRTLFDVSYEVNKVILLQTALLMTFSIGRPNEHRNFWSWHGTSVHLAKSLGLHRSMVASDIPSHYKSLFRRLWWIIVIRDTYTASLIGQPFHINFQQCDMEMLTQEDFERDIRSSALENHPLRDSFALYQVHKAKLACILRQIILTHYCPGRSLEDTQQLNDALRSWLADLPPALQTHEGVAGEIFGRCLSMAYQHQLMLLNFRSLDSSPISMHSEHRDRTFADAAADTILSLACKMVRSPAPLHVPHEVYPALFLAEVVFLKRAKCRDRIVASAGHTAVATCQVLWHSISESWDSGPWVLELFDKTMAQIDRGEDDTNTISMDLPDIAVDLSAIDPTFGGLSNCLDSSLENGAAFSGFNSWMFPPANDDFWMGQFS